MLKSILRPYVHDWVTPGNPEKRYLYTSDMGAAFLLCIAALLVAFFCTVHVILARGNAEKVSMVVVYVLAGSFCSMVFLFQIRLRYEFDRVSNNFSAFYKFPAWTERLSWFSFRIRSEPDLPLSALNAIFIMTQTLTNKYGKRVVFQLRMGNRELASLDKRATILKESVYICFKPDKVRVRELANEISNFTGAQIIEINLKEDEEEEISDITLQS